MISNKSVMVVMPAYRAGKTLEKTWRDIPHEVVDHVLLVDDASDDDTVSRARESFTRIVEAIAALARGDWTW